MHLRAALAIVRRLIDPDSTRSIEEYLDNNELDLALDSLVEAALAYAPVGSDVVLPEGAVEHLRAASAEIEGYHYQPEARIRAWVRFMWRFEREISVDLAIAQAIVWCAPRADPDDPINSLRSSHLRPAVLDGGEVAVRRVWHRRRTATAATRAATPVQSAADFQGGRLLLYFHEGSIADGSATEESAGFFDDHHTPPWDTWITWLDNDRDEDLWPMSGPYLVSWVPPAFIDLAAEGMESMIDQCVGWLDEIDVPLRAELRQRGVID
jgi:hypothetical protein